MLRASEDAAVKRAARQRVPRRTGAASCRRTRVGDERARRRLGPPPPRPRRADLHRPARPHRDRPARLPPGARAEAHAAAHALRSEDVLSAAGTVVRRDEANVNPNLPTGEIELTVDELERARRRRDAAVPDRRGRPGRRGAAPAPPLPRPAPRPMQQRDRAAPRRSSQAMREHLNAQRLPRDRDADPDALDARGRARLPRAEPGRSRARSTRCRSRRSCSSSC